MHRSSFIYNAQHTREGLSQFISFSPAFFLLLLLLKAAFATSAPTEQFLPISACLSDKAHNVSFIYMASSGSVTDKSLNKRV